MSELVNDEVDWIYGISDTVISSVTKLLSNTPPEEMIKKPINLHDLGK